MTIAAPMTRPSREPASRRSVLVYNRSAERIADLYESTTFDAVHAGILDLLPAAGAQVLDVGAGSGRDAASLAARGYRVTAVEPSHGLRQQAILRHPTAKVEWLDDALPDLRTLANRRFAMILVSAVWMHLALRDRLAAMRRLEELLEQRGRLIISLRRGPADPVRSIAKITPADVQADAGRVGLRLVRRTEAPDALGRREVAWSTLVLEKA
jgi:2-polyprenyl-3-methyl-5-hydroxy-6-metoxy-1,4-benzoquinol methylase